MADESDVREIEIGETAAAFAAMRELRPAFVSESDFVRRVDEVQRQEGYRLAGSFEAAEPAAAAVAGFRLAHSLAWGRHIYVDDLSTLPSARRRGHAGRLLGWLLAEAERLGCDSLQLDSGVGPQRADAHRLYLNQGLRIEAHHFARRLGIASGGVYQHAGTS